MADFATVLCVHDDYWFLPQVIASFESVGPVFVFVSSLAWDGSAGSWERTAEAANLAGAIVEVGDWPDESLHRRYALDVTKSRGHRFAFIPDGDEVIEPSLLTTLQVLAQNGVAERFHVAMDTYWKSPHYVIRPREALTPLILLDLEVVQHVHIREYHGGRAITLGPDHGVLHHLSYAGPDERILRKITTWGHRSEVGQEWYRRVWLGWDEDRAMTELHPTHPRCYGFAERVDAPEILHGVFDERIGRGEPPKPEPWPSVSIVIPLYGGEDVIRACLSSLTPLLADGLLTEVLVVDDASPDDAALVAESFTGVKVLRISANRGFAAACNTGAQATTAEVVIFLNSDTVVPRAGLIRLVGSLMDSGSIGAAGPMTNSAGYFQATRATYTSTDRLELFAQDFAGREVEDRDVDMLVGFCLAIKKRVLDEVGLFDERFGRGLFEDTDLCYRIQRAGYRLRLASKAYIHHEGSATLNRQDAGSASIQPGNLLAANQAKYIAKWNRDVETGYASHLPGLPGPDRGPVRFNEDRHPEKLRRERQRLARHANISLVMIVKNEERVLAECLASTEDVFAHRVIVDTGSTDRTKEIAASFGVSVHDFTWVDSFSAARNESLRHAKGDWIFWMDADDTLPEATADAILDAVLHATPSTVGFVVPVQFVEENGLPGTRVDHVKLFRRLPGLEFEGRIHEQILPSLRKAGGALGRIDAPVLHSGYDRSPEGQARKRIRDERLLKLDLKDRPGHPFPWFNLGMTLYFTGEVEEAMPYLRKSIELANADESHVRKSYALLGQALRDLGETERALEVFTTGLQSVGPDLELLYLRGNLNLGLGKFSEAIHDFLVMDETPHAAFSSLDPSILSFRRSHALATSYSATGKYAEARSWWKRALSESPHAVDSAMALFDAALGFGDLLSAREACRYLERAVGLAPAFIDRQFRFEEAMNGAEAAAGWLRSLCQMYPTAPTPGMTLARLLCRAGRFEESEPMLRGLAQVGIQEAMVYLAQGRAQSGHLVEALEWMSRAREADPGNDLARTETDRLEQRLGYLEPPSATQRPLLAGPHVGRLGPATKRFSVVVVTYESGETLKACLESLLPTLGPDDEILIVDNHSSDSTLEVVSTFGSGNIVVLAQDENLGYAKAANIGALASSGEFIVFLNPDTTVRPNWLERLSSRLVGDFAVVGPLSDNVSGDQFVGKFASAPTTFASMGSVVERAYKGKSLETRMIAGLCLMMRREVLDEHGLLCEETAMGADDLEISWRLRRLGYRLAVALDVFVHHEGGASFASLDSDTRRRRIGSSDDALIRKLATYYHPRTIPSSYALFGSAIFEDALRGVLAE